MEPDKKLHFNVAMIGGYALCVILFIVLQSQISSAITMVAGILAILAWEFVPKWLKEKTNIALPSWLNRTFSIADMWYGIFGLAIGLIAANVTIFILLSTL